MLLIKQLIVFDLHQNCIESINSKLSADNKNIRIFVYTNLRDKVSHLCSLVSYVNRQLTLNILYLVILLLPL